MTLQFYCQLFLLQEWILKYQPDHQRDQKRKKQRKDLNQDQEHQKRRKIRNIIEKKKKFISIIFN